MWTGRARDGTIDLLVSLWLVRVFFSYPETRKAEARAAQIHLLGNGDWSKHVKKIPTKPRAVCGIFLFFPSQVESLNNTHCTQYIWRRCMCLLSKDWFWIIQIKLIVINNFFPQLLQHFCPLLTSHFSKHRGLTEHTRCENDTFCLEMLKAFNTCNKSKCCTQTPQLAVK